MTKLVMRNWDLYDQWKWEWWNKITKLDLKNFDPNRQSKLHFLRDSDEYQMGPNMTLKIMQLSLSYFQVLDTFSWTLPLPSQTEYYSR